MKVSAMTVALFFLNVLDFLWLVVTVPAHFVETLLHRAAEQLELARLRAKAVAAQRALDRQVRASNHLRMCAKHLADVHGQRDKDGRRSGDPWDDRWGRC